MMKKLCVFLFVTSILVIILANLFYDNKKTTKKINLVSASPESDINLKATSSDIKFDVSEEYIEKADVFVEEKEFYIKDDYSDIYQNIGPKGMASIYPALPDKVYFDNLDKALSGNAKSQYKVSKALKECIGIPDYAYISELENQSDVFIDEKLSEKLYRDAAYCNELFSVVPRIEIEQEYMKWYVMSLSNNDSMALAIHWLDNTEHFSKEKAKDILQKALYYGDSDIYFLISSYYANYFVEDTVDQKAWDIIHCKKNSYCNEARMLTMYQNELKLHEYDDLITLSESLYKKISKKEHVELR